MVGLAAHVVVFFIVGNTPNFMVKAIAEERGIRMPGFLGYMAWSGCVLLPLFAAMTFIWFP